MENIPEIDEEKPKGVDTQPVGLGNTEIATDYAQNPSRTLLTIQYFMVEKLNSQFVEVLRVGGI